MADMALSVGSLASLGVGLAAELACRGRAQAGGQALQ